MEEENRMKHGSAFLCENGEKLPCHLKAETTMLKGRLEIFHNKYRMTIFKWELLQPTMLIVIIQQLSPKIQDLEINTLDHTKELLIAAI